MLLAHRASVALLLSFVACGGSEAKPPEAPSQPAAAAPSSTAPATSPDEEHVRVDLVAPGTGERRELRYTFHPGHAEQMDMTMRMAMAMKLGAHQAPETKIPPVRMLMTIDPKSTKPNGDLVYRYAITTVDVATDPAASPDLVAALRAQLQKLVGLAGEVEVTPRGGTVHATMEAPASLDANTREVLDQVRSSLRDLSAPFPNEPVGIGAKWRSVAPFAMSGIRATRTVDYELKSLDGDHASLDERITLSADPQPIEKKGLPAGAKLQLLELRAGGGGTVDVNLQSLVPSSKVAIAVAVMSEVESDSQKTPIEVATKLDMTVSPQAQ